MTPKDVLLGKYKHYKGGIYEVLSVATHSENKEVLVIYKLDKENTVWARPLEMFFDNVTHNGKSTPRFQKLS